MTVPFKYYYVFGVRQIPTTELKPKLIVDFIIDYTTKDVENSEMAKKMIENEMLPTTGPEAVDANGLSDLNYNLTAMSLRCRMNNISVHKIITEHPINDEEIESFVASAAVSDDTRRLLNEARIDI